MTDTLPPDFPADLRGALGLPVEPMALPGPVPITQAMRDALAESRRTKGKCH